MSNNLTLTQQEKDVVITVRLVCSFLSFFGSLFIIGSMVMFQRYRRMASRLILALTVCALLEAFANVFSVSVYGQEQAEAGECFFQGFLLQFSQIAIFGWITVIAANLYLVVVHSRNTANYEVVYHGIVWAFAVLFTLIPLASDVYGPAGVWCWMKREAQGYRWGLFYVPLYIMMAVVILLYALIQRAVRNHFENETTSPSQIDNAEKLLVRLKIYPIVFVVCFIFPTINRIYDVAAPTDSFVLYLLAAASASVLGFINAIVYGFDVDMRRLWKSFLYNRGCCMGWTQPSEAADVESSSDVSFN
eukprot:TRINITY_DN7_c0_g1_i9.p1 TRINITY_DN7_c0_g1~~TRINITY_DN7_c0_g1_i9.p1  ORF type:complete len:304 (-),score=42.40 TRINITY_DN7_c0_g1_i9:164-1075(-)